MACGFSGPAQFLPQTLFHLLCALLILSLMSTIASFMQGHWSWGSQEPTGGTKEKVHVDSTAFSLGIKELAPNISAIVDIIAIHGLDGHREASWTDEKTSVLWLRDLLPHDIQGIRVLTYGYDANTRGVHPLSSLRLNDHAENLMSSLAQFRKATPERPIIFVAHSLGGIVLKEALIHAAGATRDHLSHHKAIFLSTYGIIFLGTPHQGSSAADLGQLILRILSLHSPTNVLVAKHLGPNSEKLQEQLSRYQPISGSFDTRFFYEAYETPLIGLLVPKASAVVPGAVNVEAMAINKDHVGMAKYGSADDPDYQTLEGHISDMVAKAQVVIGDKWEKHRSKEGV